LACAVITRAQVRAIPSRLGAAFESLLEPEAEQGPAARMSAWCPKADLLTLEPGNHGNIKGLFVELLA
jgi:hypothetical protein